MFRLNGERASRMLCTCALWCVLRCYIEFFYMICVFHQIVQFYQKQFFGNLQFAFD